MPRDLNVPMPVHGSIIQQRPHPLYCTALHDWRATRFPSLGWTQASISLYPCPRRTRTWPSLWYRENRDSSLKIQCLHCLRSHTLCLLPHSRQRRLCSKVGLGHLAGRWEQYPAARSRLGMVRTDIRLPNRTIICIHRRGAEMWSGSFWPFGAVDGLPMMAWRFSSNLHVSSDVVGQSLGCFAKFCLCILETHPASWLLIAENCHLPTNWQFAAVFALANFVAWSLLKVQRNINSLYRNPTLHKSIKVVMVKQTSLRVITPELTFSFSWISAAPRQYWRCLAIQFGYIMDRWNQQYFVPQLNIRPETINTDHYCDTIMGTVASQVTSLKIVYTTVYSDADQSKHQSSTSLASVWGIHRGPVNSSHKWPVTRKMFPFDDVIMSIHAYAI